MSRLLLVFLFIILASFARQHIYQSYQHLALKAGVNLNNIATKSYVDWIKNQEDDFEVNASAIFLNEQITFRDIAARLNSQVLGQQTRDSEKWIEVDLSDQKLYMREQDKIVGDFLISSGKWAPTPQGEWRIWTKLRYTRMRGGSRALGTFYDLPNVPYVMYYDRGYGVHGAYWHNNFGQPMSHGCINMKPEEAGIVFNWASVGTRVVVHE